jgi:hypothetical protein
MKAMLWVYSSAVYDDRFTSEVLFWGEDADDLDVGDASRWFTSSRRRGASCRP